MNKGFTIIEVLLSVSILAFLSLGSITVFQSFQRTNDLNVTINLLSHTLRRAQGLAQASDGDSTWGVALQTQTITLFKGGSYATRDSNFDELLDVAAGITMSGLSEVVFSKVSGDPQATGTTTLQIAELNETRAVNINAKGMVSF